MSDYAQMEEQLLAANAYILTLGGTLPAPPLAGPPQVVDVPVITGNGIVGETLSCTMGNWSGEPTSYTYAWKSNGTTDLAGTDATYVITDMDVGTSITCVVTAINAVGPRPAPPSNAIVVSAARAAAARAAATATPTTETTRHSEHRTRK